MSERLIDAVCPHCERVGTTVRVVLHEDGFTKLSRRCTDCGGEWIHTFDRDWLADAENKKLLAEIARLREENRRGHAAHKAACMGGDLLQEEIVRLREALEDIARGDYSDPMCERTPEQRAREALEDKR